MCLPPSGTSDRNLQEQTSADARAENGLRPDDRTARDASIVGEQRATQAPVDQAPTQKTGISWVVN